jgi:transposase
MARPFEFTEEEVTRAKEFRDNHSNEREYRAGLIFLQMTQGRYTTEELSDLFGISLSTVGEDIRKVRNPELAANKAQWGGGRNRLMTFDEETQFLDGWLETAKEGLIPTMPELHAAYNKLVGRDTPKSTFYRLLERHNWRKVLPDTRHPKADSEKQEEFKKKRSKWSWKKLP